MPIEEIFANWPDESVEAARIVINSRGEPDETTESMLIWHAAKPWKRIVAYRDFDQHNFPSPHIDCIESVIDYRIDPAKASEIASFDGSVLLNRTNGELSARCHDEQANFLAINLAQDVFTGEKTSQAARSYYAKEFLDFRRGKSTPYMEALRFIPDVDSKDADIQIISDEELEDAKQYNEKRYY